MTEIYLKKTIDLIKKMNFSGSKDFLKNKKLNEKQKKQIKFESANKPLELLKCRFGLRVTGSTKLNKKSSRGHFIYKLLFKTKFH